jgi:hypothetical protein
LRHLLPKAGAQEANILKSGRYVFASLLAPETGELLGVVFSRFSSAQLLSATDG